MEKQISDRKQYLPQLSIKERDRRWKAVREQMVLNGLDCLVIWGNDRRQGMSEANLRYLTQIGTQRFGGICVFPIYGEPKVFVSGPVPAQFYRPFPPYIQFYDWIKPENVVTYDEIVTIIEHIKELGFERGNIGLVDAFQPPMLRIIPYEDNNVIRRELPKTNISIATALVEQLRLIKSNEEINFMRKAADITRLKIDSMIKACKVGARECEVYAKMVETDIANGGEAYCFYLFTSGSVIEQYRQHLFHGKGQPLSPTTRELTKGDLVITEFHTSYGGYLAGAEKSVFIGKPPDGLKRLHDVAVECITFGIRSIKPDVTLGDVWKAFNEPLKKASMDCLELGVHGHGLSSPDYPWIDMDPNRAQASLKDKCISTLCLKENMVVNPMVDIFDPNWRDDVGVMIGTTVLINKSGAEDLVNSPFELTCV
jgi:Xaa-Pro aminopeptidase